MLTKEKPNNWSEFIPFGEIMLTLIFVTLFILLFCIWFYLNTYIPEKFPPGPPRYPILGSSRYILVEGENGARKSIMHGILKNVEKYGKLFGFYLFYLSD